MIYVDKLNKDELNGKKVILRVDFDVPFTGDKITEDFRIRAQKETIDYLADNGAKVLLVGHLGHETSGASFNPIVEQLGDILGRTLSIIPLSESRQLENMFNASPVLLLDNIRQDAREIENDDNLAQELAKDFDFYVNNDFAVMHRNHASVVAITKRLPSCAGLLVKKEIEKLGGAINEPAEGKVLILGGAKIATKLPVIKNFLNKADEILIGGALANNFFRSMGINVGASTVDEMLSDVRSDKIILPRDILVTDDKTGVSEAEIRPIEDIRSDQAILDIGPKTVKHFLEVIGKSKMIIWNGPMGVSEISAFAEGTRAIAKAVAAKEKTVIGGGDTIAAVDKFGLLGEYGFVSTGGGAMLEFLAGNKLPGLEALGYYD